MEGAIPEQGEGQEMELPVRRTHPSQQDIRSEGGHATCTSCWKGSWPCSKEAQGEIPTREQGLDARTWILISNPETHAAVPSLTPASA